MAFSSKGSLLAVLFGALLPLAAHAEDNTSTAGPKSTFDENAWTLSAGYATLPNNQMVQVQGVQMGLNRRLGDKLSVSIHYEHWFDLGSNDLKGLTQKLVELANNRSNQSNFEQPVEKPVQNLHALLQKPLYYGAGI
jgi:hypothetical protein